MAMGTKGMADMALMSMPLPPNTLPMMTGTGQFGPIEMGGMFTVMKVREDLAPGDSSSSRSGLGMSTQPGTVAHAVDVGAAGPAAHPPGDASAPMDEPAMSPDHKHHY